MAFGEHARGPSLFAVPTVSLTPENWVANGRSASAYAALKLAGHSNTISGKRKKVLWSHIEHPGNITTQATSKSRHYGGFYTGPDTTSVRVCGLYAPANSASASHQPRFRFHTQPDGGSETAQPWINHSDRNTGTLYVSDAIYFEQVWTNLDSSTKYFSRVEHEGHSRIVCFVVFEDPGNSTRLDIDDVGLFATSDRTEIMPGGPITTGGLDRMLDAGYRMWKQMGSNIFSDQPPAGGTWTRNNATLANIHDQTLTAYGANNPGYWFAGYRKGTYDSRNIPVTFRALGSDNGGAGLVRLVNSGGTICTITVGTTSAWYEATGNLDSSIASEKLDVLFASTSGANTIGILTVGLFELGT